MKFEKQTTISPTNKTTLSKINPIQTLAVWKKTIQETLPLRIQESVQTQKL